MRALTLHVLGTRHRALALSGGGLIAIEASAAVYVFIGSFEKDEPNFCATVAHIAFSGIIPCDQNPRKHGVSTRS